MSVSITPRCITCGACVWECPTEAILPGAPRPVVEETSCTECYGFFGESQCVVVCPVGAITTSAEPVEQLAARFRGLYPGQPLEDTWMWRRLASPAQKEGIEGHG
jgi:Fe-S-cluster-containing hydrogenase component 2